jgi:hypothetical protein
MKLAYLTAAALAAALVSVPSTGALAAKTKSAKPAKVEYLRAAVATPTPAATTTKKARKAAR